PLVPVMATTGQMHSSKASSSSPMMGIFFRRTFCTSRTGGPLPGLRMQTSDPLFLELDCRFSKRSIITAFADSDLGAFLAQKDGGGFAAVTEAENDSVLSGVDHRSFKVASPRRAKRMETIQKRTITVFSFHPLSSKWWWIGEILMIPRPVILKLRTCKITDSASMTNTPPTITRRISCLQQMATAPSIPPMASDPVSPMNTRAGNAFHQRNPRHAPSKALQTTASSPEKGT